jgi:hypothetical protein
VTDKVVVVFQNCVNLLENVPGSCNETCHDRIEAVHIKVEEDTYMQEEEEEEEDPDSVAFPVVKVEDEVSSVSVPVVGTFYRCTKLHVFFFVPHVLSSI